MRISNAVLILAFAFCAGCTTINSFQWSKEGVSQDQFMKDRYGCIKDAQQTVTSSWDGSIEVIVNCDIFKSCMAGDGYSLKSAGGLDAPKPMNMRCK